MKKFIKIAILLALLLGFGYFVYERFFNQKEHIEYITTHVTRGDIVDSVVATGEVYAQDLVDVGAEVGGQIKKLYVNLGDYVQKGDMIAQIDSVKQENAISQQKAQLLIHEANLNSAKIAEQNAKIKYKRELSLLKKEATSKESVENAKNDLASKEALVKQILSQIDQANIELNTAYTNLGYTKITAPLSGTVVSIPVQEGKTVNANQTTPTIAKIADLTKMEIRMQIAEGDLPRIKSKMKVFYSTLFDLGFKRNGEISSIDPALTTLSDGIYDKVSGSSSGISDNSAVYYYARVLVNNKDNFLKIGMTTENLIVVSESNNTLYIPTSAIKTDENGKYVMVFDSANKAVKKPIKIGVNDNFNTEIIDGLSDDDTVIISQSNMSELKVDGNMPVRRAPRI